MSGQLVGEVIAASPQLRARGVTKNGFLALITIAEKASNGDRQASVRWAHLQDGLYGASVKTARRAVKEIERLQLIRVVSVGWANQHGASRAPVYELRIGTPVSTSTNRIGTAVSTSNGVDVDKSKVDVDKSELDVDTRVPLTSADISLDGFIDGSIDGGRARERTDPTRALPDPTIDPPPIPADNGKAGPNGHAPIGAVSLDEKRFRDLCASVPVEPPQRTCTKHTDPNGPPCHLCRVDNEARDLWHVSTIRALDDLARLRDNTRVPGLPGAISVNRRQRLAVLSALGYR